MKSPFTIQGLSAQTGHEHEPLNGEDHEGIAKLLSGKVHLDRTTPELLESYKASDPYPYLILDNFFSTKLLDELIAELPGMPDNNWVHHRNHQLVKSNLRSPLDLGPTGYQFTSFLNSAGFLYLLSEMTGIWGLLPDPYLGGAGFSVVPSGGKFDVHADRNTDLHAGLFRRIVVLTYLNKDWDLESGGQLELWNVDGTKCEKVIEPLFNRVVIMEIGDKNFHAVRPVLNTSRSRMSFTTYYHTVGEKGFEMHHSIYAPSVYQKERSVLRRLAVGLAPPLLVRALKFRFKF